MFYYKVPIINGKTDCSAGSILCCAYPQGSYMFCKFESVATVGSGWVEITEEQFEASCPDFPAVTPDEDSTGLPKVSADDNGKTLMVVEGEWRVVAAPQYNGSVKVE